MKSALLSQESDVQLMREVICRLPRETTIANFEEAMLLASVRAASRLWWENDRLVGFAFVDDFNNLRFEIDADGHSSQLEDEIIAWGSNCIR